MACHPNDLHVDIYMLWLIYCGGLVNMTILFISLDSNITGGFCILLHNLALCFVSASYRRALVLSLFASSTDKFLCPVHHQHLNYLTFPGRLDR